MSQNTDVTVTIDVATRNVINMAYVACLPVWSVWLDKYKDRSERLRRIAPYLATRSARRCYGAQVKFWEKSVGELRAKFYAAHEAVESFEASHSSFINKIFSGKKLANLKAERSKIHEELLQSESQLKYYKRNFNSMRSLNGLERTTSVCYALIGFESKHRPWWHVHYANLEALAKLVNNDQSSDLTVTMPVALWTFISRAALNNLEKC